MKTSALLSNEFGEPIHDFYLAFSAAPGPDGAGEPDHIASALIVEGVAQAPSIMPVHDFLQPVHRPFAIEIDDVIYLNTDCRYGEDALTAIKLSKGVGTGPRIGMQLGPLRKLGAVRLS
ncbi:hypothetical protein [Methylobacterium sp. E-046]|uniref:hypothetical protein n=1 Tax=Methylobacterium sp. E-046 TaxID=2836576 RepID=UPI001FBB133A|nr:hypothetical protein [Methylobacterium sp. E-046]MCJ2098618.1 hypothetical protein [Methylobacterium sp. E-046]